MITKEQALDYTIQHFHYGHCTRYVGPRGGVKIHITNLRRNGQVQTWKTRPNDFRMPVKYGVRPRDQFSITHLNADQYHADVDCPILQQEQAERALVERIITSHAKKH